MSFRRRFVAAVSAMSVVTLGGAFTTISVVVNASQRRQLDLALLVQAADEARQASTLGDDRLRISDRPGPAANDVGPLTKYGAIYAAGGRVLATTPTFRGSPPPVASLPGESGRGFDLWFGDEHLRGVLVGLPGHEGVRLLLAAPRTDLDSDEAFLNRALLIVFCIAVTWTVLLTTWIVQRLTREHEAITRAARRVAAGDLSARVATRAADPEIAQLARDIDDMIERIGTLVTSQQRFIAEAAHELRSPLTTLYGELALALRKERQPAEYRRAIEEALDSARRLKDTAEDLLVLARLGAEERTSQPTGSALDRVRAAAAAVASEADERGVAVEIGGDDAPLIGQVRDLERLLRNLLENAVRHSPRGGVVNVDVHARDTSVEIAVTDGGAGIAEADQGRIFEPFYRGAQERAGGAGGAGLGLTIAREIARAHGGDLALSNSGGDARGARFIVRLPSTRR